jgi:hypothetical protein
VTFLPIDDGQFVAADDRRQVVLAQAPAQGAVCGLLRSPTKRPEREGLPRPKAGILVVDQLKPAVFQGTAVGFPLPENQGIEGTSVFRDSDLNNHLVVHALLLGRHDFCGNRGHECRGVNFSLQLTAHWLASSCHWV